jgi:hypothetical protein
MTNRLEMARQLVAEGERDPVAAVKNQRRLAALLRDLPAESRPEAPCGCGSAGNAPASSLAALGVTHLVRVDSVPSLSVGQTSPALKVEWPGGQGVCRSLFAGTLDGDPVSLSRVSVRIAVNGSDDLFTDGEAPAFVPLIAFQAANHNWFRLRDYAVSAAQRWVVYFQYEWETPGLPPITPFLLFGYKRGN